MKKITVDASGSLLRMHGDKSPIRDGTVPIATLLTHHFRRGQVARFEGPGLVEGVTVADLELRELSFDQWGRMGWRPRWATKTTEFYAIVRNCTFKNLSVANTYFGSTRFINCRFDNVDFKVTRDSALIQAHFESCHFSGTWEGNFTSEADVIDNVTSTTLHNNDFSQLLGFSFVDTPLSVLRANRFDLGGNHLAVGPKFPGWPQVRHILAQQPPIHADILLLLEGRHASSTCEILVRDHFDTGVWQRLIGGPHLKSWNTQHF